MTLDCWHERPRRDEVEAAVGTRHRVTSVAALNVIGDSPRLRERGLTRLVERVYRLDPQD
jgi:thiopurine S-methyltransferase